MKLDTVLILSLGIADCVYIYWVRGSKVKVSKSAGDGHGNRVNSIAPEPCCHSTLSAMSWADGP